MLGGRIVLPLARGELSPPVAGIGADLRNRPRTIRNIHGSKILQNSRLSA
jgi:hypothetical protein